MLFIFGLIFAICLFDVCAADGAPQPIVQDRRSCRPGQTIADLKWKERGHGNLDMTIKCINVTSSCEEKCEWRPICTNPYHPFGPSPSNFSYQYIRGIETFFDATNNIHRAAFLCCAPKNEPLKACRSSLKDVRVEGPIRQNVYLRDATSNETSLYIEKCTLDRPVHQLCPISRMRSEEVPRNVGLYGLFGLAGLAGLGGLALIVRPSPSSSSSSSSSGCQLAHTYCSTVADVDLFAAACTIILRGQVITALAPSCQACARRSAGACCTDRTITTPARCILK